MSNQEQYCPLCKKWLLEISDDFSYDKDFICPTREYFRTSSISHFERRDSSLFWRIQLKNHALYIYNKFSHLYKITVAGDEYFPYLEIPHISQANFYSITQDYSKFLDKIKTYTLFQ